MLGSLTLSALILAGVVVAATAGAQPTFHSPDRIRYDGQCFTLDGKDVFLYSGAFHYFRCPKPLWRARFQMIKDAGFNAVETYVPWNYHEQQQPKDLNDFSKIDLRELDEFLTMAEKEFGLYTIVRPGPYICAEWATGGFPQWLMNFKPSKPKRSQMWVRSDDPVFLDWSQHWYKAVGKIIKKHQLVDQPLGHKGVILVQIENEYTFAGLPEEVMVNHLRALAKDVVDAGITVPIFTSWTYPIRGSKDPLLSQVFDCPNQYPWMSIEGPLKELNAQHNAQPWAPRMITEFQGGWFSQVGVLMAEEQQDGISAAQENALTLNSISGGMTGLNYYMLFGGTNFGDWAAQYVTTSYDYFAPIREWGGGGAKYEVVRGIGKMLQQYGPELVRSVDEALKFETGHAEVTATARKTMGGVHYIFIQNSARKEARAGNLAFSVGGRDLSVPYALGAFGYKVLRVEPDFSRKWLPEIAEVKEQVLPANIRISKAEVNTLGPTHYRAVASPVDPRKDGIYDARFVFYRFDAQGAQPHDLFSVRPSDCEATVWSGSKRLMPEKTVLRTDVYPINELTSSIGSDVLILNPGWHNGGVEMEASRGLAIAAVGKEPPIGEELARWRVETTEKESAHDVLPQLGEGFDDKAWKEVAVRSDGSSWEQPAHSHAVYRTSVEVPDLSHPWHLRFGSIHEGGWVYVNGKPVGESHNWVIPSTFDVTPFLRVGQNTIAVFVHNSDGGGGLLGVDFAGPTLDSGVPLKWEMATDVAPTSKPVEYELGAQPLERIRHPKMEGQPVKTAGPLVRSVVRFDRPDVKSAAWEMVLEAGGDGFLTLNGHPLGRFWERGPQFAFYLPECWMKAKGNVLELVVRPGVLGDRITAAELRPLPR